MSGLAPQVFGREPEEDDWVLPPEERPDDTLEFDRPVEIQVQKFKLQTKLPWRVRLREWRRRRKLSEAQAELELLHGQYLDGLLLYGTDLRDAVEGESRTGNEFTRSLSPSSESALAKALREAHQRKLVSEIATAGLELLDLFEEIQNLRRPPLPWFAWRRRRHARATFRELETIHKDREDKRAELDRLVLPNESTLPGFRG